MEMANAAQQSCRYYRMTCGLPAVVRSVEGRSDMVVVQTGAILGITVPSALGEAVVRDLRARQFAVGATVGHHRSGRWTFLVRADLPASEHDHLALFARLFRLDASVVRDGAEIALPSSPRDGFRYWVADPPGDEFRPAASVVVEAIRRVTEPSHAR
ncbi:hypothetical protein [Nocardia thailandica]|uniref:hypothetical protein n=1 Tax=Nocardia thailandica TaxID=257275 RepID=UPI0005BE4D01|nr:hypothetical protein [Nocardia thailandica]